MTPGWLLIYKRDEGRLILALVRNGSHSDLFLRRRRNNIVN
ncbi:hypothetical protein B5F96_05020 [Parabacteroides johnsonii]|uniref:Addiction module toxin RelE n=1 Tax=Parabacteroides johnsonii TaxID=387661 RepID=A0A9Q5STI5_9BACT|nr:hypothetical protein B5F96_05020 [Parabacteroides johnsonii]